jgi:hypothetical protein
MRTGRLLHWLAIRAFVVAVAVIGVWLLISGVVPTTPPSGDSFPVADSFAAPASSTSLAVSPASSVAQGTAVTLSARVTRATAAGTVQFKDGSTIVGDPVRVSNGTASQTTSMLAPGPHRLIAVFTPPDPIALRPSTSPAMTLTVTGPQGNGTLPTISPEQSGLSLDSPVPVTLDSRVPTAVDSQVPTILDGRLPTGLDIQAPTVLDNRVPAALGIRVPSVLDNQARSVVDVQVPSVLDIQVPTTSDNRMPKDLDGRERTSMTSGCLAASSASCSGRRETDQSMTSCHHSKCGSSRSKCGSPNAMTSGPQQQPAQSSPDQSTTGGSTTGGSTTGGSTTGTG